MDAVNVRQLKNNPSEALRSAVDGPVLVLKGDRPEALLIHLDVEGMPDADDVRLALATSLFKDGVVSLGRAARIAQSALPDFVTHLSRLGLPVVSAPESDPGAEIERLDAWLGSS